MKHIIAILLIVFAVAFPAFSTDIIPVDVSGMNEDDALAYMFLYGFEAIMEETCKGCFLAMDENLSYLGGWRTTQTPEDFAVNIPSSAIAIPQVLPKGLAMTMFSLLGDFETSAAISGITGAGIYAVCIFLPEEGMVVSDPTYNYGQKLLEDELTRHGLNPDTFYSFMEQQGITLDMMVATMYRGDTTAREIVVDAMGMMESVRDDSDPVRDFLGPQTGLILQISAAAAAVFVIVMAVVLLTRKKTGRDLERIEKEARREEHNDDLES